MKPRHIIGGLSLIAAIAAAVGYSAFNASIKPDATALAVPMKTLTSRALGLSLEIPETFDWVREANGFGAVMLSAMPSLATNKSYSSPFITIWHHPDKNTRDVRRGWGNGTFLVRRKHRGVSLYWPPFMDHVNHLAILPHPTRGTLQVILVTEGEDDIHTARLLYRIVSSIRTNEEPAEQSPRTCSGKAANGHTGKVQE